MRTTTTPLTGRTRTRHVPLARRLFLLQLVLIVAVCAVLSVTSYLSARDSARDAAADRVLSIAETLAHDPFVAEAVAGPDPSAALQPYAQTVIDTAEVDFVTIMDADRTRYTHPDPTEIGKPYIGSIGTALTGQSEVEEYAGTLGPSVRAIAPIMDASGEVTAMVAVGVTLETISLTHAAALPQILIVAAVAIALGGLGAWILSRYLKRVTLGYGPEQLKRLFAFYDSAPIRCARVSSSSTTGPDSSSTTTRRRPCSTCPVPLTVSRFPSPRWPCPPRSAPS
ncbi:hypothetical protein [Brevibacterium ammoniilyticum]|uniref:hypothetical protein n=1 Tax=Brevibacterium ammoniilyticum TaxID=1046555 RepID=UPI0031388128